MQFFDVVAECFTVAHAKYRTVTKLRQKTGIHLRVWDVYLKIFTSAGIFLLALGQSY